MNPADLTSDPAPLASPRAVLFDFDGVVADTANLHLAAWERTFGELGWSIEPKRLEPAAWLDDRSFVHALFRDLGLLTPPEGALSNRPETVEPSSSASVPDSPTPPTASVDLDHWVARKRRIAQRIVATSPPDRWLAAGAEALIRHLQSRDGLRLGLVTSALRADVAEILGPSGLFNAFDPLVTRDDPTPAKPDPGPYRLALERLGMPPHQAVALEDSPNGLASARAAGLRVVLVGSVVSITEHDEPSPTRLHDLRDLSGVLTALGLG